VNRATNVSRSAPNAEKFRKPPPGEIPSSTRPWLSRSTAVTAAASWSGSCKELTHNCNPEPQPLGAGCRVRQHLQRSDERGRADRLLHHPTGLKAELLGPGQITLDAGRVKGSCIELWDRDGKPHAEKVAPGNFAAINGGGLRRDGSRISPAAHLGRGDWRTATAPLDGVRRGGAG
jgi:hypothetical protein